MNILFIGGSNLLMRNGMSMAIPRVFKALGVELGNVWNISVGATGSLFGLENLNLFSSKNVDLVFVEYGINDLPTFSNDRQLWEQGYRSLLNEVNRRYPNAHVVNILLGRQAEKFWERQDKMHAMMASIAAEAGALVIDIDNEIKLKGARYNGIDAFYRDGSHYVSPTVTNYISELVVSNYLLHKSMGYFKKSKSVYSEGVMRVFKASGSVELYENSLFRRETTVLNVNESVSLEVQGTPVAISFISEKQSCSLLIEGDGFKKIINTRRREADEEKFSFLLKQIPLYRIFDAKKEGSKKHTIKITAVDEGSNGWNEKLVQNTFGMVSVKSNPAHKVSLGNISTFVFD